MNALNRNVCDNNTVHTASKAHNGKDHWRREKKTHTKIEKIENAM